MFQVYPIPIKQIERFDGTIRTLTIFTKCSYSDNTCTCFYLTDISSTSLPNVEHAVPFFNAFRTLDPIVHVGPQTLHEVNFTVPITAGISPEAQLLMHYTSPEGEVVADSISLKINKAFENKASIYKRYYDGLCMSVDGSRCNP